MGRDYLYYVDFPKVISHVDDIKISLSILGSLIGSKSFDDDFRRIAAKYPETLECIPILLAVRQRRITVSTPSGDKRYELTRNGSAEDALELMHKTGLADMIERRMTGSLVDYVFGVETGMDTNARKNRSGTSMERIIDAAICAAGLSLGDAASMRNGGRPSDLSYFRQLCLSDCQRQFGIDMSPVSNNGKERKRFDFILRSAGTTYGVEVNFFSGTGSKLNEVARSYKKLGEEAAEVDGFEFLWITDGRSAWEQTRGNLEEAVDAGVNVFNLRDVEDGLFRVLAVGGNLPRHCR